VVGLSRGPSRALVGKLASTVCFSSTSRRSQVRGLLNNFCCGLANHLLHQKTQKEQPTTRSTEVRTESVRSKRPFSLHICAALPDFGVGLARFLGTVCSFTLLDTGDSGSSVNCCGARRFRDERSLPMSSSSDAEATCDHASDGTSDKGDDSGDECPLIGSCVLTTKPSPLRAGTLSSELGTDSSLIAVTGCSLGGLRLGARRESDISMLGLACVSVVPVAENSQELKVTS
jgi:hypothetical protein